MNTNPEWQPSDRELQRRSVRRTQRLRRGAIAALATGLTLGGLALLIFNSPGWPRVQETFFSGFHFKESFPDIADAFWLNVKLFMLAEPLILALALGIAVARNSRSAWLTPLRLLATIWTDLFRGIPTLLLVVLFGFGMPALNLTGMPNSLFFWALVALVVSYSAYVAEVIRAGIDSIHPSQWASADALGLSRAQTLRHVVVPQAVRRVLPPLLNDFVSLQKDTALVSSIGLFDALFTARDYGNFYFNYTPLVVVACFFVVLTVPLARFTDWLQRRMMERERASAR